MKKTIYTFMFFILIGNIKAQDYLSFYNLKDYVIQTQNLSPIFLPKYSVSFGTPANIGIDINSDFKISDILVENGGNLSVDLDNLNLTAQENNAFQVNLVNNLFMLGFKLKKGSITVFANTKTNLLWEFSDSFTNFAATGFGSSFALSNERLRVSSYSEIGVGFTQQFFKEKLTFGIRLKSLNGIAHGEIKEGASFAADINNTNFNWVISSSNATVNTSGFNDNGEEFSLFTGNTGFGIDLGLNYKITEKLSVEAAVNDLGSINWKDNVTNYNVEDNNGTVYQGFDFEGAGDVVEEIETAFGDIIGANETNESFTTELIPRIFISAKYDLSEKNSFRAVYFSGDNPYILNAEPSYSLGYNRNLNKSTYGLTAGAGGVNNDFRFGANLAVQLAFIQLYAAIDDFSSIGGKVQDVKSTNLRFGINFLFGYNHKESSYEDEEEDFKKN